jgi:Cytochrome c
MLQFHRVPCVLALVSVIAACTQQPQPPNASATPQPTQIAPQQTQIERGKHLVDTSGCHDCHTPKRLGPRGPEPDMDRALSGHPENVKVSAPYAPAASSLWIAAATSDFTAWSGPWGVSFAANLTPDTNTGLRSGVWTEDLFIKAIRSGKHMGTSRDILPPMPWPAYGLMTDDELRAIWEYLGTIRPTLNHVPDPIPPAAAQ